MTRSLLLGLDPSPLRLGWGLVDLLTGEPIACGCEAIDLPAAGWSHRRAMGVLMAVEINGVPGLDEVQAVYIEDTAKAGKYRQHDAGRAQGIVQSEVERRWPWAPVQFLAPAEWKKLAGLKGNASKDDVMVRANTALVTRFKPSPSSQDAADALLIAIAGQRRNGESWARGVEQGAA